MARLVELPNTRWMRTRVQCYTGYGGEEAPQSFDVGQQRVNIVEIIDRWLSPDHRYFKVKTSDRKFYVLRQGRAGAADWEIAPFSQKR